MTKRMYIRGDVATRLAAHSAHQPNGCIHWIGAVNNKGYGQIRIQGKGISTHRAAYEIAYGALQPGEQVLHRCDNPKCINSAHLFVGTPASNCADKVLKGRQARGSALPHTKLSDADVAAIRKDGGLQLDIARKYGVTQSQISRIISGVRRSNFDAIDAEAA